MCDKVQCNPKIYMLIEDSHYFHLEINVFKWFIIPYTLKIPLNERPVAITIKHIANAIPKTKSKEKIGIRFPQRHCNKLLIFCPLFLCQLSVASRLQIHHSIPCFVVLELNTLNLFPLSAATMSGYQ